MLKLPAFVTRLLTAVMVVALLHVGVLDRAAGTEFEFTTSHLGLVLFETLTGRLCANQPAGTRTHLLRSDVPKWLDDLVAQMLSQNAEDRQGSF